MRFQLKKIGTLRLKNANFLFFWGRSALPGSSALPASLLHFIYAIHPYTCRRYNYEYFDERIWLLGMTFSPEWKLFVISAWDVVDLLKKLSHDNLDRVKLHFARYLWRIFHICAICTNVYILEYRTRKKSLPYVLFRALQGVAIKLIRIIHFPAIILSQILIVSKRLELSMAVKITWNIDEEWFSVSRPCFLGLAFFQSAVLEFSRGTFLESYLQAR